MDFTEALKHGFYYTTLSWFIGKLVTCHFEETIEKWKPNSTVARTVINLALNTGRLGSQSHSATLIQTPNGLGYNMDLIGESLYYISVFTGLKCSLKS